MERNGLSGRLFSNMGGGMLGLEMPLLPHPQPTTQNPEKLQQRPQMVAFSNPHQPHHQPQQIDQQIQLSMRQPNNPFSNENSSPPQKPNTQMTQLANSDEDEPGCPNEDSSFDGKRKNISPWQRMKWTDSMVRLLIMAVYYIGDEAGCELGSEKKKPGGVGSIGVGGQLQKKGKWKSVSRAMMEKGFRVSPQQCEDKFNDLNKRYKRVNDILGKGTACKVVENQSLLDTMDHLSPKMREEVRKLLNSKHLFFREMCAYHNSCGHGSACHATEPNPPSAAAIEAIEGTSHRPHQQQQLYGNKSSREKKQWVMTQLVQLEEQGVKFQYRALELEKQKMKWIKFSSKKEREIERMKIENERKLLENERMVLLLRQKEIELLMFEQRPSNPSCVPVKSRN
ncbi:hypothetical protein Cgig2_003733 [Carnegiea gigantea]|uniref:Myb/SANT-like DNA-binding domain-containing protein n=1 Tax=Carnegiea gigantea TaxID=171969 RepID=A0A9Q1JLR9_9CARY|nr:hypothetical protein Cgig2_003733 [Carnegiea gigantea]